MFKCLIFALPYQKYLISLILGVFENFEKRLAGQKRGLPNFLPLADLAVPKIGVRQCVFWEFQKWPNGPGGTLKWVPPVSSEGSARHLQKILPFFLSPKLVKCQTIILSEKHLPSTPIAILEQLSLTKTIRKPLPSKNSNSNITNPRNSFEGSFKPLKHFQPNHIP